MTVSMRGAMLAGLSLMALGSAGVASAQTIVQPGMPGQASRTLSAAQAAQVAGTRFTNDDVRFMQHMIVHHRQATEMSRLAPSRATNEGVRTLAARIEASQADEIRFMQDWLRERRQPLTAPGDAHHDHSAHAGHQARHGDTGGRPAAPAGGPATGHMGMAGMATPAQMRALAASRGAAFDRMFLDMMIAHHEGALTMSRDLLARPGSAYDPVLAQFVTDVQNEQQSEINRMAELLGQVSGDPRVGLRAGFRDAGEAISNMRLVASLPKPPGFFDAASPSGLPPELPTPAPAAAPDAGTQPAAAPSNPDLARTEPRFAQRASLLDFAQTDLAFQGDLMAVGNYHGVNLYRLAPDGSAPTHISSIICPGGQGDVSLVGDLMIMSVEQNRSRTDCGSQGIDGRVSSERFRGLRIFNIADPRRPRQVGQVQTCRGSHTHSVVSGPGSDGRLIVYNSGIANVREEAELAGCVTGRPGDERTALFRIDVIEIPVADPSKSRIIDSPAVFADEQTGRLAGLWRGGDHGRGTQQTAVTDHCHDITVFPELRMAAGACSGNGIIFDISDPRKPQRIDAVNDPNFAYWHSATFNNDGTRVIFTDEWGGGARPRCRAQDPREWGANAIYEIVDGRLQFRSHYKMPAAQTEEENCVAHNGSIVPVPGRDIFVQAWYQGGISLIDFTDPASPVEIGYFDRGPVDARTFVMGGYWSVYWYNGRVYGTEIARGLDVFALTPSQFLTENEIAAATLGDQGRAFNPQQQTRVTWPQHPVVALAYLDQLERGRGLAPASISSLRGTLTQARTAIDGGRRDAALAGQLQSMAGGLSATASDAATTKRLTALRETLGGISQRLR